MVDAALTLVGRPETELAALASAPSVKANFDLLAKEIRLLKRRADRTDVRLSMIPAIMAIFAPIKFVPLGYTPPIKLKKVDSPNIRAQKGEA